MYCPRCGSGKMVFMPWVGAIYRCYDCKYQGPMAVGRVEKMKKVKGESKKIS